MRALLTLVVVTTAIVLGNYWFNPYVPMCRMPVSYTIGEFDERFGVSHEEALASLQAAENVWEEGLARDDVFEYDPDGPFKINFIYDERQRQAEEAQSAREILENRGGANEVLTELHRQLISEYEVHENEYESKRVGYERDLADYNAEVERYNSSGGAPSSVYQDLEQRRLRLDEDRQELESLIDQLEELATQINSIGEKGNELIGEYNDLVHDFNDTFAHGHEYTQGDYRGRQINIYSFTNQDELILVLAHELGHALAIGHVDDPESLMYYLMKDQPRPLTVTDKDIEAFRSLCEASFVGRLLGSVKTVYNSLINI